MDKQEAISPHIKGLFDTVRQQAAQYSTAFRHFESEKNDFERQKKEFLMLLNNMQEEFKFTSDKLHSIAHSALSLIEDKADSINKVYSDIKEIKTLLNSFNEAFDILQAKTNELDSYLALVKARDTEEIQKAIKGLKDKTENDLEKLVHKLEIRLLMKLRDVDDKFIIHDKILLSLNQARNGEIDDISKDLSSLSDSYKSLVKSLDETSNSFEMRLNSIDSKLKSEISRIENKTERIYGSAGTELYKDNADNIFEFKNIDYKLSLLTLRIVKLESLRKFTFLITFLIFCLIIYLLISL